MQLKKLLVSGFKSFVDNTDIRLPSHLVGVVGPNGCGKSNVIDAIRWVMGESSAKMLRGDNMADVIFNGSSARKPVGKASVELIFDNSDGQAPGNYRQFAEISVKRTLTRDGISTYQINNLKTRRRDVLDLFRGTGLGSRSYSIIEQGMVNKIVEARPEDLRVFVEEAAGTSRYKDRRRETENRIQRSRENLDRVGDIRDELGKQLRRLKRQSASARRYKALKTEEREVNAQLHVLKFRALDSQLLDQDRLTASHENALQATLAKQRQVESELESLRSKQSAANEKNSQIQQDFYRIGGRISNLEQKIEHNSETRQRRGEEVDRLESGIKSGQHQIEHNQLKREQLNQQLANVGPNLEQLNKLREQASANLAESEKVLQEWLSEMEAFTEQAKKPDQQIEVQKSRITYLEQNLERLANQKVDIENQLRGAHQLVNLDALRELKEQVEGHDQEYELAEQGFRKTESEIKEIGERTEAKQNQVSAHKKRIHESASRLASLREIQAATVTGDSAALDDWLVGNGLQDASRLASQISIEPGWERAVDRILSEFLGAICAEDLSLKLLRDRPDYSFTVICEPKDQPHTDTRESLFPSLSQRISTAKSKIQSLLQGVYIAETSEYAIQNQHHLNGRELFVTQTGTVVGTNWVSFASQSQMETGILVREEEIHQLEQDIQTFQSGLETVEAAIYADKQQQRGLESELDVQRSLIAEMRSKNSALHNEYGRKEAQNSETGAQIQKLGDQLSPLSEQIHGDQAELENARTLLITAREESGDINKQRQTLAQRRTQLSEAVSGKRDQLKTSNDNYHQVSLEKQKLEAGVEIAFQNIERIRKEIAQSESRLSMLSSSGNLPEEIEKDLRDELELLLEQKRLIDAQFSVSQDEAAAFDNQISQSESIRSRQIETVNQAREQLEAHKMTRQELVVRKETLMESINQQGIQPDQAAEDIPDEATLDVWQEKLEDIERKITRIGPVNLVAIEEFDEEQERMEYLDTQHKDLTEALDTLESVIKKIDRETRTRFRETFEKINEGFSAYFPRLFGGGVAELELESDDFLTTGIRVMARPPGKRNSHIHLLSGGEKALTAVALLFSLFELNPAPFCVLDEVDAPLDDNNVDRYCDALKQLATRSQMIVITHNKITMEAMDLLVGVTMAEAGVSRLVSVDINEAVQIAAQ